MSDKDAALIAAVLEWSGDRHPNDPGDARLMQAIWHHEGPTLTPCPECDGDCGEPCAPISVEAACAELDHFIAEWNKKHGIVGLSTEGKME
jgi:hypothetical protein